MTTNAEMNSHDKSTSFSRWKPVEIMLAILFLVAPFYYHLNMGGEGLRIPNNITVWLVACVILSYTTYLISKREKVVVPKYYIYMAFFPLAATVSGFVTGTSEPVEWLFRLIFIWFGLLFFFALFQQGLTRARLDRLMFIIVISAIVHSLIGISQSLYPSILPDWLPKSSEEFGPYSTFLQINNHAIYQVTALIIASFLLTRPYITKGNYLKKSLLILFFALSAFIISSSGSRAAILALVLACPMIFVERRKYFRANSLLVSLAVLFFVGGFVTAGHKGLDEVVEKASTSKVNARVGIYKVSLDLIKEKPIFGHGLASFGSVWQYQKAIYQEEHPEEKLVSDYVTHPHNEVMLWLVEGGVVAGVGLLVFSLGLLLSLKNNTSIRWTYLALLTPLILHTQVELPFYISAIHWFLFIFLLYVAMHNQVFHIRVGLSNAFRILLKMLSVGMMIMSFTFLSHSLIANRQFSGVYHQPGLNVLDIDIARQNIYFNKFVTSLQMHTLLLRKYENKSQDGLSSYIAWANNAIKTEPNNLMFTYLAMAYQTMDNDNEMCRVLLKGVSIYPEDYNLASGAQYCSGR